MPTARLYTLCISHPGLAVRGMLEHKGIDHKVIEIWPGTHPAMIRLRGFTGSTVPALQIGGRRYQHSLKISQALDELVAEPALFPADAKRRREVVAAEQWGAETLQSVPRRIFRYLCAHDAGVRRWLAETAGIPAPGLVARDGLLARRFAKVSGAEADTVRADLAALPMHLDYVVDLIDLGVLGGESPNAADFQIAASLRSLQGIGDVSSYVSAHRASRWANAVLPPLPGPCPAALPAEWLAPLEAKTPSG